jgi:hypothetical protein
LTRSSDPTKDDNTSPPTVSCYTSWKIEITFYYIWNDLVVPNNFDARHASSQASDEAGTALHDGTIQTSKPMGGSSGSIIPHGIGGD